MTPIKKFLWISTIAIGVLLVVGAIELISKSVPVKQDFVAQPKIVSGNESIEQNESPVLYNQLVSTSTSAEGIEYQKILNDNCGLTLEIPVNWLYYGYLGELVVVSPEDNRINEEWDKTHQELILKEEGDAPLGPNARSLYISCQYGVSGFLGNFSNSKYYQQFAKARSLSEAFATEAFRKNDSGVFLQKTFEINRRNAYELSWTVDRPAGLGPVTNDIIAIDRKNVLEIQLGQTKYDDLSVEVKRIINSISFED